MLAFVLAGGKGTRLYPLTKERAKPAVPFGGRYRIVDFVLSNLVNSGVYSIYVLIQSANTLLTQFHPSTSWPGIGWLAATLLAMLLLAWGKRVTGQQLGNPVLLSEARVTLVDALLAAAVLVGLVLNAAFGFWWADPLAGLVIVYYGLREGWAAWHHS